MYGERETSLREKNILLFTSVMNRGGTERVIVQISKIMQKHAGSVVVCSRGGVGVKLLEEIGVKHITIPDIRSKNPVHILRCIRALQRIIKTEKIDVIHTHHRMAAFYATLLKWYKKYTVINTCHCIFTDKRALTRWSYKRLHLIAVGEQVKKNVVEFFGLPEHQVATLHNVVEAFDGKIDEIEPLTAWKQAGNLIVGNSGRICVLKGMDEFLRAIPQIQKHVPHSKFAIIGDGEEKDNLIALTKELGIEDDVAFLGYRTDVQNALAQVDVVALTSHSEGLPLTPIEAFSVGKPMVATAVGGTPEVVQDGVNGYLIPPRKVDEIAEKLVWILQDEEKRTAFGENAQRRFAEEFSFEIYEKKITEYYQNVCK